MSKVKKNKLIKELEETLIKKGVEIDDISDVLKKIENNLKDKKYGLVWEEHTEEIEKELLTKFPILKEEKELRIEKEDTEDSKLTNNFLIEGDNLESLTALRNMGKKVDVIYIDPPYNTGNEFVYQDKIINKEDSYRHSKWISFMGKRLSLAKELLTDDGMILISIDDNEYANLKLLCDDVLGEECFVCTFLWRANPRGRTTSKHIAKTTEYILMYCKNYEYFKVNKMKITDKEKMSKYKYEDEVSIFKKGYPLHNGTKDFHINNRPNLAYSIYYNPDKNIAYSVDEKEYTDEGYRLSKESIKTEDGYFRIIPKYNETYNRQRVWRWGREKFEREYKENLMFVEEKDGWYIYGKDRLIDGFIYEKYKDILDFTRTDVGTKELKNLGMSDVFSFPKPVSLLKHLTSMHPNKDANILDFFAGSGTTGQAVLELNKEDGGNRNFILCTNNENNICRDITYQRINKVINGYTTPKGKEVEGIDANLTYLKTELIEKEEDLLDLGVDDTLKEVLVNNLKVTNNVTKVDELTEEIYKLEGSEEDYYLHFDFFVDDSIKKIKLSENKKNVVYVTEDNLTDVRLNMFDEVRSLNDLLVYK